VFFTIIWTFCRIILIIHCLNRQNITRSSVQLQLDQNSLASEMRTRGNERVSVRQGYGYGCRYGTLNEANLLKTARTCCSLEAWSADFRPLVHDLNTSRPNRQVRSANGRDFSPLRHSPSCSGRPVGIFGIITYKISSTLRKGIQCVTEMETSSKKR
jgi:hypothetical protein